MNVVYYAHSYRDEDADVVRFFGTLMRSSQMIPSLDPPSDALNSAKPERHLRATDGMVAVLTARKGGPSAYILYEISLCLRARKPVLVFIEDMLPDGLLPPRVLQRRFNRTTLLRDVRDHRHALALLGTYMGADPPPRYQPAARRRSCLLVGLEGFGSDASDAVRTVLESVGYEAVSLEDASASPLVRHDEQELLTSADIAVCYVGSAQTRDHYALGAVHAFLTPAILIAPESWTLDDRVPAEYQPRLVAAGDTEHLTRTVATEMRVALQDYVDLDDQAEVERYAESLLNHGDGSYGHDTRSIIVKELVMRDKYEAHNVGAMGPGARATNVRFYEVWGSQQGNLDLAALASELDSLRRELREQASSPDDDRAVAQIAEAQLAAEAGDGPTVLERLANAGEWALKTATTIGTTVAAAAIKTALGV